MVEAGLELATDLLAVACSSHWARHGTSSVRAERCSIGYGLDAAALANTADLPLDRSAADEILRRRWWAVAVHDELLRQARRACWRPVS